MKLPYNIYLIGFMGTGKSTVSQYLAKYFAMETVEMDQEIAQREGKSIPEIFAEQGEEYFRNLETKLLVQLEKRENTVVSCGGGTPLRQCNVDIMKRTGKIVLLLADAETILERVKDSHDRPLLENNKSTEFIQSMLDKRMGIYRKAADFVISTDGKKIDEICNELIQKINSK